MLLKQNNWLPPKIITYKAKSVSKWITTNDDTYSHFDVFHSGEFLTIPIREKKWWPAYFPRPDSSIHHAGYLLLWLAHAPHTERMQTPKQIVASVLWLSALALEEESYENIWRLAQTT